LGGHARRAEQVGIPVGQSLDFAVAHPPGLGDQGGPVSATFADPGIEEKLGDVEVTHGREDRITARPLTAMTYICFLIGAGACHSALATARRSFFDHTRSVVYADRFLPFGRS